MRKALEDTVRAAAIAAFPLRPEAQHIINQCRAYN